MTVVESSAREPVVAGSDVFVPSVFQSNKFYQFKSIHLRFLKALRDTGDISKAAEAVEKDEAWAARFLNKPDVKAFLADIAQERAIASGITVDWLIKEFFDVAVGNVKRSRESMEALKEIGARLWPKVERVSHSFEETEFDFIPKPQEANP